MDDADLGFAAMIAGFTICSHAGQGCAITSRAARARGEATPRPSRRSCATRWPACRYGDPTRPGDDDGPADQRRAARQGRRVRAASAVADGAKAVLGGPPTPSTCPTGYFYEPTLLVDVDARRGDRPGRDLRPGAGRAARTGTTTTRSPSPTTRSSGCRPRSSAPTTTAPPRWPAACGPARSASTGACGTAPTRRSAATSSRASAARWASPASRSTSRPRPCAGTRLRRARDRPMQSPMSGVKVLEVAMYGFVTSAGAVLADWGADVLKVEHATTGDPQRGLRRTGSFVVEGDLNPNIEHPNRGKRSIGLDIATRRAAARCSTTSCAQCRRVPHEPAARRPRRSSRSTSTTSAPSTRTSSTRAAARSARKGEEAERGGYDMTAFWCRAGTAASITPPDIEGMITPARARLRRHDLRHQPRRRHRRRAVRPGAHRRAVGRRRVAARQRAVVDGHGHRLVAAGQAAVGGGQDRHVGVDQPADQPVPDVRRPVHLARDAAADAVLGRRVPRTSTGPSWPTTRASPRTRRIDANQAEAVRAPARGDRRAAAVVLDGAVRHAERPVGAGAGHAAGGRRRADPRATASSPR